MEDVINPTMTLNLHALNKYSASFTGGTYVAKLFNMVRL